MTRVAIVGAGAIGMLLAARLQETPAEVTLIARPAAADIIRTSGITMVTPTGRVVRRRVTVTDDAMGVGAVDIVFLCVKAHALSAALDTLTPLMGTGTPPWCHWSTAFPGGIRRGSQSRWALIGSRRWTLMAACPVPFRPIAWSAAWCGSPWRGRVRAASSMLTISGSFLAIRLVERLPPWSKW